MKNVFKKIALLILSVLCILGLSACSAGSTIETELTINQDLSGKRVMEVAINADAFRDNFHGDINTLNQIVESNCPKELTWKYQNLDGVDSYHVELDFSSPEDYKQKVERLLGKETTLELSAPATIWANGFRIEEGFTSSELLDWMADILVEGAVVDSSNRSSIFSDGSAKVIFGGKTFDSSYTISVNQLEYLPLERIDVLTSINDVDDYERSVIFYIPTASMSARKNEIETFLNGNVPDGADSQWESYERGTMMKITKAGMDLATLNAYNQKVLAAEKNEVLTEEAENETSVFSFSTGWKEKMDFSSYAGDESGRVQTNYYLKTADDVEIYGYPGERFSVAQDDAYPGYGIGMSGKVASADVNYIIEKSYPIQEADVTTTVKGTDSFERESVFVLANIPDAGEQEVILSRIQQKAGELAEVAGSEEDASYAVTVTQKGTEQELGDSSEAIFDGSGVIRYGEEKGLMSLKHQTAFTENFSFQDFIYKTTDDYKTNYTVKTGILNSIDKASISMDSDDLEIGGGKAEWTGSDTRVSMSFAGSKWNLPGIVLWLVILAAAAVIVRGLIVTNALADLKKLASEVKEKRPAEKAGNPSADDVSQAWKEAAAAAMPEEQANHARFCPECGSPMEPGSAFCENCGHKLEE